MIVLNSLNDEGAGFGHDTNKVSFFFRDGSERTLSLKSKTSLAIDIVDEITELIK
jgi:phosphopantothenoylcysteine decarboxylase/phosphopantothenate--cysteine ligase